MIKLTNRLCSAAIAFLSLTGMGDGLSAQTPERRTPATPKNLQILTSDVNLPRLMASFNAALGVQCTYCHIAGHFASDANPKKEIARRMLQLWKNINMHFPDAGNVFLESKYLPFPEGKQYVTCYTCHRGAVTPANTLQSWHGPERAPEPGSVPLTAEQLAAAKAALAAAPPPAESGVIPPLHAAMMHKNMVYLPHDVNTTFVMPAFRAALGVECSFCHVAGAKMEIGHAPDRESDLNPKKLIARNMIGMMKEINETLFPGQQADIILTTASTPPAGTHYVTCYTCHRGDQRPSTAPPAVATTNSAP